MPGRSDGVEGIRQGLPGEQHAAPARRIFAHRGKRLQIARRRRQALTVHAHRSAVTIDQVDGVDVMPGIRSVLARMRAFSEWVRRTLLPME